MARLHQLVVAAAETTNLEELGSILIEASQLARQQGQAPHTVPEVRFISFQIAFAGDGDMPHMTYYKSILDYCTDNEHNNTPKGEAPSEPTRQTS